MEGGIDLAKRARACGRFSFISHAKNEVAALRQSNKNFDPALAAWIIFCEGLIHHFEHLDVHAAMERFRRSYAIAVAIGHAELSAANRAWIANCQFMEGNASVALDQLEAVFGSERKLEPETLARAYLVLADLTSWSGQPEVAKEWYRQARLQAVEYGDLAFQALVMYNSASFHVADMTLQDCLQRALPESEIRRLSLEVASIVNLDKGIGQPHLSFMIPLLHADMLILERKFSDALILFDMVLENIDSLSPKRLIPKVIMQRAWARAKMNMLTEAANDCRFAEQRTEDCSDIDDLAIIHARLAMIYEICKDRPNSERSEHAFGRCLIALQSMQASLRASIGRTLAVAVRYKEKTRPEPGIAV